MEEIYDDELECPNCNTLCESWNIEVAPNYKCQTIVTCEECSTEFIVEARLELIIRDKS